MISARFSLPFLLSIFLLSPAVCADEPFQLLPDKDLQELFGYDPEYAQNVVTFDSRGRPYIRSRTGDLDETSFIQTLRDGKWIEIPLIPALQKKYPNFIGTYRAGGTNDARIIFDKKDRFYTVFTIRLKGEQGKTVLLYSKDFGKTIEIVEVPRNSVPVEHVSGHNKLAGPPLLMLSQRRDVDLPGDWAVVNKLFIIQPRWEDDEIVVPQPVKVTDMLLSIGQHSGGSSFAVTQDAKTHFVWPEATEDKDASGSPTFIATFDQKTGKISEPVFLAHAPPLNNAHNVPGICIDSEGYLHVVTGSHYGESFYYTRSLAPNRIDAGWTKPEPVWSTGWTATSGKEAGGQTYVALVCDPDDTLHLVFRHWQRQNPKYEHLVKAKGGYFAALAHQRKRKDEDWSKPKTILVPARNIYSIYYQKLSVNPSGNLFLSASYMDRELLERSSTERFINRMILTSSDDGKSWYFAKTEDFLPVSN